MCPCGRRDVHTRKSVGFGAFTLIELLVVISIIALLVSILIPSLSRARDSAKRVKTQAAFRSVGDALEMLVGDNTRNWHGSYPPSKLWDDPTEPEDRVQIFGAQWLVRYLMGKDMHGYVPETLVSKRFWGTETGWEQKGWYDAPGEGDSPLDANDPPLPRCGPYLTADNVRVKAIPEMYRVIPGGMDPNGPVFRNLVLLDAYDWPILYYASSSSQANLPGGNLVTWAQPPYGFPGVYSFSDNAILTGGVTARYKTESVTCTGPSLLQWGFAMGTSAPAWKDVVETNKNSFAYYVLNKGVYDSTDGKTIVPCRKDSFLLISPGKDALFGTPDDIKNFE